MRQQHPAESFWGGIVKSMGLVFGDIGTSPIYTLTVIFAITRPTRDNIFGILSLIVWTMIIIPTMQYVWLALKLGRKGEGGTIVLKEILIRLLKKSRKVGFVGVLSFIGVSLLLGDGVITPAISILSAIEGMLLIPGLEGMHRNTIVVIAAIIAMLLFIVQYKGTDKVAGAFGPLMVIWFSALSLSGLAAAFTVPGILTAVSPHYALEFLIHNGVASFFVLSEVILCATGSEAIYADMGHLGRKPIIRAWCFVLPALLLNYIGQGAFLLGHPGETNLLFTMVKWEAPFLYVPFVILTVLATVIASQAMISGVFSIIYQGITTRVMPLMKVDFTSRKLKSQIYIGSVNWSMMIAVLFIIIIFRESGNLAAAYGLAVTGTMTITGTMMTMIFSRTTRKWKVPIAATIALVDLTFLLSCLTKLPHGGFWSLILASIPLSAIFIWTRGQRALYRSMKPLDLDTFLLSFGQIYAKGRNIPGTALFFTREKEVVPPYVVHCIIRSNIIYERNFLVSIMRTDEPFGLKTMKHHVATGLEAFEIKVGYMEVIDLEKILKKNDIVEKVIFYGIEDISTRNIFWRIFSMIKKQAPTFVQFHKLPAAKLQGVVTRVEM